MACVFAKLTSPVILPSTPWHNLHFCPTRMSLLHSLSTSHSAEPCLTLHPRQRPHCPAQVPPSAPLSPAPLWRLPATPSLSRLLFIFSPLLNLIHHFPLCSPFSSQSLASLLNILRFACLSELGQIHMLITEFYHDSLVKLGVLQKGNFLFRLSESPQHWDFSCLALWKWHAVILHIWFMKRPHSSWSHTMISEGLVWNSEPHNSYKYNTRIEDKHFFSYGFFLWSHEN